MTDLALIRQLGELLSRPIQAVSEEQFKRHEQARYAQGSAAQDRITRDAYCLAEDGTVSGLLLQPVTSELLYDFPFQQLGQLKYLYLSTVELQSYSFLSELTGLTTLFLSFNRITDFSFLSELAGLTTLDLCSNDITDCSFLSELTGLTTLNLSGNSITNWSFLSELMDLTTLYLSDNSITDWSFLSEIMGLTTLDLSDNSIVEIPKWLAEGRMAVEVDNQLASNCINLYNNPIEEPPLEIVRQGNAAILSYYDQLATQGQDHLYEAKMLIVGEGEAGKTTLAQKILEPNCPLPHVDDRTRGISIKTHTFPCPDKDSPNSQRDFHLNIWDFGGQEIYHYTHRFFLSKRSLYVLVADNRKDDTDFNYWLHIIEHFADSSPLIIVLNEKGDIQRTVNRAELRSRYPDSIKEILPVNFKTHEEPDKPKASDRLKGINALIGHIQHCAQNLPHIGEPVPARWVDVRQAIEADPHNYIYREQFDHLCQTHDITAPTDIDTLLGYFHDLGILLHFADSPSIRNYVILKPTWATNAVYRIFDDDRIKAKAGRFTRQDCADIWQDAQYRYMHDVLIELMKNFRLIYETNADNNTGTPASQLVAPQLLPQNTPDYPWDDTQNSQMQFHYDAFMPKGIFWQLAVTLYRYIPNQDWVWRNGMIIQRGNTWAEIKENIPQRCVSLRFYGPSIPEFRAVIVDQLDSISQSYHQLKYEKMIPCQCSECAGSNQPKFFEYSVVKERQEKGKKDTIECRRSEEDVNLDLLLRGYEIQAILQTIPDKHNGGQNGDPSPPTTANPVKTSKSIFISYRRSDSNADTGRIYDRLVREFGEDQVFKDTASVPPAVDFVKYINQSVSQCQVVLAIIGKTWIDATESESGTQRLANPKDFVRIELELALKHNIPVFPVFLDGACPPKQSQLPQSLHSLPRLNGIEIDHDPRFDSDVDRLVNKLKDILGQYKNNY